MTDFTTARDDPGVTPVIASQRGNDRAPLNFSQDMRTGRLTATGDNDLESVLQELRPGYGGAEIDYLLGTLAMATFVDSDNGHTHGVGLLYGDYAYGKNHDGFDRAPGPLWFNSAGNNFRALVTPLDQTGVNDATGGAGEVGKTYIVLNHANTSRGRTKYDELVKTDRSTANTTSVKAVGVVLDYTWYRVAPEPVKADHVAYEVIGAPDLRTFTAPVTFGAYYEDGYPVFWPTLVDKRVDPVREGVSGNSHLIKELTTKLDAVVTQESSGWTDQDLPPTYTVWYQTDDFFEGDLDFFNGVVNGSLFDTFLTGASISGGQDPDQLRVWITVPEGSNPARCRVTQYREPDTRVAVGNPYPGAGQKWLAVPLNQVTNAQPHRDYYLLAKADDTPLKLTYNNGDEVRGEVNRISYAPLDFAQFESFVRGFDSLPSPDDYQIGQTVEVAGASYRLTRDPDHVLVTPGNALLDGDTYQGYIHFHFPAAPETGTADHVPVFPGQVHPDFIGLYRRSNSATPAVNVYGCAVSQHAYEESGGTVTPGATISLHVEVSDGATSAALTFSLTVGSDQFLFGKKFLYFAQDNTTNTSGVSADFQALMAGSDQLQLSFYAGDDNRANKFDDFQGGGWTQQTAGKVKGVENGQVTTGSIRDHAVTIDKLPAVPSSHAEAEDVYLAPDAVWRPLPPTQDQAIQHLVDLTHDIGLAYDSDTWADAAADDQILIRVAGGGDDENDLIDDWNNGRFSHALPRANFNGGDTIYMASLEDVQGSELKRFRVVLGTTDTPVTLSSPVFIGTAAASNNVDVRFWRARITAPHAGTGWKLQSNTRTDEWRGLYKDGSVKFADLDPGVQAILQATQVSERLLAIEGYAGQVGFNVFEYGDYRKSNHAVARPIIPRTLGTGQEVRGFAINPLNGNAYYTQVDSVGDALAANGLYLFNPKTGESTKIGRYGVTDSDDNTLSRWEPGGLTIDPDGDAWITGFSVRTGITQYGSIHPIDLDSGAVGTKIHQHQLGDSTSHYHSLEVVGDIFYVASEYNLFSVPKSGGNRTRLNSTSDTVSDAGPRRRISGLAYDDIHRLLVTIGESDRRIRYWDAADKLFKTFNSSGGNVGGSAVFSVGLAFQRVFAAGVNLQSSLVEAIHAANAPIVLHDDTSTPSRARDNWHAIALSQAPHSRSRIKIRGISNSQTVRPVIEFDAEDWLELDVLDEVGSDTTLDNTDQVLGFCIPDSPRTGIANLAARTALVGRYSDTSLAIFFASSDNLRLKITEYPYGA